MSPLANFQFQVGGNNTLTSSSLPQGVSFESNTLTLEYDGINSIASNITVYAASITNNFSVDVGLESFEFSKIQGRIDSLSLDSGFNSGDTFEDISNQSRLPSWLFKD